MNNTKTTILQRVDVRVLLFAGFLGVSVAAPYIRNQLVTGSIVNATLFMAVITLGLREAMMICLIPSLVSISTGLLPIILAPMIPFIMLSNATLVATFDIFRHKPKIGFVIAPLAKFVVIYGASFLVASLIKQPQVVLKAAAMMGYMQLVTVLIGAAIAMSILNYKEIFKR